MRALIGLALGLLLAGLAGWTAMSDQLAKSRIAAAADFPLNRAVAAKRFLDGGINPLDQAASVQLARDAISAAPMTSEASAWLALNAEDTAQPDLLAKSARLGWHGELAQTSAYRAAIDRRDYAQAMIHAEALLRRGRAREALAEDFERLGADPAFRAALTDALAEDADWSNGFLGSEAGQALPDQVLLGVFEARREAGHPVRRSFAAPLISRLSDQQRHQLAVRLSGLMRGGEPGKLLAGWPDADAEAQVTPYDWRLFNGHSSIPSDDGESFELGRNNVPGARPAQIQMALRPGRYRLTVPGRPAGELRGWKWGLSCNGSTARPTRTFGEDTTFVVGAGCPLQMLSVAGDLALTRSGTLPSLDLARVQ